MNKIISLILILSAANVKAGWFDSQRVLGSSITVSIVNVSSFTPTQVDDNGIAMSQRIILMLQNLDSSNDVFCSEKVNISTTTGFLLSKAGTLLSFSMNNAGPDGRLTFYCLTAKTSGASKISVIQGY